VSGCAGGGGARGSTLLHWHAPRTHCRCHSQAVCRRFWLPNYRTALKAVYIKGKPFVIGNMTEAASVVLPNTVPGLPCAGRLSIAAPGWVTGPRPHNTSPASITPCEA
jgi:hypothetical protein